MVKMVHVALFLLLTSCGNASNNPASDEEIEEESDSPQVPFGSHLTGYTTGTILPNHITQDELDNVTSLFYDEWKNLYIGNDCGDDLAYVDVNAEDNDDSDTLTVSEAHGYGMMIAAFMAGYDDEAQDLFDRFYSYYRNHPSAESDYLMTWNQTGDCEDAEDGGDSSATDGDLDIAYALLLADAQWDSEGEINYREAALNIISAIEEEEIHPSLNTVMLGDWTHPSETNYYNASRTSDWMPEHFRAFQEATDDELWNDVVETIYDTLEILQANFSPLTGLLPDFVINLDSSPEPAGEDFLEDDADGTYNYNACRDPWRLATDYLLNDDTRALTAVQAINDWIRDETGEDPSAIMDGYELDGDLDSAATYNAIDFVAPFGVGAMVADDNQEWLNSIWDLVTQTGLDEESYYGNTLKMLSLIVMSGNWWSP